MSQRQKWQESMANERRHAMTLGVAATSEHPTKTAHVQFLWPNIWFSSCHGWKEQPKHNSKLSISMSLHRCSIFLALVHFLKNFHSHLLLSIVVFRFCCRFPRQATVGASVKTLTDAVQVKNFRIDGQFLNANARRMRLHLKETSLTVGRHALNPNLPKPGEPGSMFIAPMILVVFVKRLWTGHECTSAFHRRKIVSGGVAVEFGDPFSKTGTEILL